MADATTLAAIRRLGALVTELAGLPLDDLIEPDASQAHATVRRAQDALGVLSAKILARVEADGRWATTARGHGVRNFDEWVAKETKGSRAGARRQTRLARAVEDHTVPGLADAVTGGGVSLEHADVLARLAPTTPARREALASEDPARNAGHLLRKARDLGVDEFTTEVKRWAAKVDPTADERGHRAASERVTCSLASRDDGVAMSAFMTTLDGAAFDAALNAVAGVPAAEDVRTHGQRMGAALGDMARLVLDHGLAAGQSGGFRPHLTIQVSLESLVAQVDALAAAPGDPATDLPVIPAGWDAAVLADGTPIPASVLARVACDSEVSRVVFGPASQVLDVGRSERLYTGAMRRAVIARDQHCAYPDCDRPPRFGEVHHIRHWAAHGGETSVENGVLLCYLHHDVVHSRYLTIQRNHDKARWNFHERDGTPIPRHGDRRSPLAPDEPRHTAGQVLNGTSGTPGGRDMPPQGSSVPGNDLFLFGEWNHPSTGQPGMATKDRPDRGSQGVASDRDPRAPRRRRPPTHAARRQNTYRSMRLCP